MNRHSLRGILGLIALSCFFALSATASAAACFSEGIRVGVVQKFSIKGLVNKSWEGELVMEGEKIRGSSTGIHGGNVWAFSVLDPAVAKIIDASIMTGHPVALKYCQVLVPLGTTDTPYRIVQAADRKS